MTNKDIKNPLDIISDIMTLMFGIKREKELK